jgi:hypothetical protein
MQNKNTIPKSFLSDHKSGPKNKTLFLPLNSGFLRIKYDDDGSIAMLHYVQTKGGSPVGAGLEWGGSNGETVTFITEMGVSGTQWNNGEVFWGTTFETDDGPMSPNRKVDLETWINECLEKMINPTQEKKM